MLVSRLLFIFILFILVMFYLFTPSYFAFLSIIMISTIAVVSFILLLLTRNKLEVQLRSSWSVYKRDQGTVYIKAKNKSILPIIYTTCQLEIHNELTGEKQYKNIDIALKGKDSLRVPIHFVSQHVGQIRFHISSIKIYDFFKLFYFTINEKTTTDSLVLAKTFPIVIQGASVAGYNTNEQTVPHHTITSDGLELVGINEYKYGEKIGNIHWNLTSKFDALMVKELIDFADQEILIVYDPFTVFHTPDEVDSKITWLLSLSKALLTYDYPHTVMWYDIQGTTTRSISIQTEEQFQLLQKTILSLSHERAEKHLVSDIINDVGATYSRIFLITSEPNSNERISNVPITLLQYDRELRSNIISENQRVLFSGEGNENNLITLIV